MIKHKKLRDHLDSPAPSTFDADDVTEFARSSLDGLFISSNAPTDGVFVKLGEIDTGKTEQDWINELSDLQRDAERYRWLRNRIPGSAYRIMGVIYSEGGSGVDAAIDAAMECEST